MRWAIQGPRQEMIVIAKRLDLKDDWLVNTIENEYNRFNSDYYSSKSISITALF